MKSPFPGMDPYIEDRGLWPDFHDDLIAEIKRALAARLPERYFAQMGERSYIVLAGTDGMEEAGEVIVAEPAADAAVTMRAFIDEHFRENFIEIYESDPDLRLVTCIEVLSPANKRRNTEGWDEYARKRQAMLLGQANFIEIDLLRGGHKMPMLDPWPESPYTLLVCRRMNAPHCRAWPVHFQRRLPAIPVPLAYPDPDLALDLQPLLDDIYSLGRYDERIDYTRPLSPPLPDDEARAVRHLQKDRLPRPSGRGRNSS